MKIITLPNGSAIAAHAIIAVTSTLSDEHCPASVLVHFAGQHCETCFTGTDDEALDVRDEIVAEWQAATQDSES